MGRVGRRGSEEEGRRGKKKRRRDGWEERGEKVIFKCLNF